MAEEANSSLHELCRVSILCRNPDHPVIRDLMDMLCKRGFETEAVVLGEELPRDRPIISALDLEEPFFHNLCEVDFDSLKASIYSLVESRGIMWVTGLSQVRCMEPKYATGYRATGQW